MIVGGFTYAGAYPRPATPAGSDRAASGPAAAASPADATEAEARPTYFRAISSISHGSLAAAYQFIRAHEDSNAAQRADNSSAGQPQGELAQGEPAILSGLGVPVALAAYGDVMEADEA